MERDFSIQSKVNSKSLALAAHYFYRTNHLAALKSTSMLIAATLDEFAAMIGGGKGFTSNEEARDYLVSIGLTPPNIPRRDVHAVAVNTREQELLDDRVLAAQIQQVKATEEQQHIRKSKPITVESNKMMLDALDIIKQKNPELYEELNPKKEYEEEDITQVYDPTEKIPEIQKLKNERKDLQSSYNQFKDMGKLDQLPRHVIERLTWLKERITELEQQQERKQLEALSDNEALHTEGK